MTRIRSISDLGYCGVVIGFMVAACGDATEPVGEKGVGRGGEQAGIGGILGGGAGAVGGTRGGSVPGAGRSPMGGLGAVVSVVGPDARRTATEAGGASPELGGANSQSGGSLGEFGGTPGSSGETGASTGGSPADTGGAHFDSGGARAAGGSEDLGGVGGNGGSSSGLGGEPTEGGGTGSESGSGGVESGLGGATSNVGGATGAGGATPRPCPAEGSYFLTIEGLYAESYAVPEGGIDRTCMVTNYPYEFLVRATFTGDAVEITGPGFAGTYLVDSINASGYTAFGSAREWCGWQLGAFGRPTYSTGAIWFDCETQSASFEADCRFMGASDGCFPDSLEHATGHSEMKLCPDGYTSYRGECVDIDECLVGMSNCGELEVCRNTPGSFACDCIAGFMKQGTACVDVDECAMGTSSCGPHTACRNTWGYHDCSCLPGFGRIASGPPLVCIDIDECKDEVCPATELCKNTPGAYGCSCIAPEAVCDGRCVDTSQDRHHCGGCGSLCGNDQLCSNGVCENPCGSSSPALGSKTVVRVLDVGANQTCAVLDTGALYCWGEGAPYFTRVKGPSILTPLLINLPSGVIDVAENSDYYPQTCAVLDTGEVYCWGSTATGQIQRTPTGPVPLGGRAISIKAGTSHYCALLESGDVRCWGQNYMKELGTEGPPGQTDTPAPAVPLGGRAKAISLTMNRSCALLEDGAVKCWGNYKSVSLKTELSGPATAIALGDCNCALLATGKIQCWDFPLFSDRCGIGLSQGTTQTMLLPGKAVALEAGACAILESGEVYCWGSNEFGRLGLGDTTPRNKPAGPLLLGAPAVAVAAGSFHTCAVLETGEIKCWGRNDFGQLGLGDKVDRGGVRDAMPICLPSVSIP